MPTRLLREGILTSIRINRLTPGAEVQYRRLMSRADDYGRFEAHPSLVRAACFPLQLDRVSDKDVEQWLLECARKFDGEEPLITLYEVGQKKLLQINNFGQRTRTASKLPAPCGQDVSTVTASCRQDASTLHARARGRSESDSKTKTYADSDFDYECAWSELIALYPKKGRTNLVDAQRWYCQEHLFTSSDPAAAHAHALDRVRRFWIPSKKWADGFVKNLSEFCRQRSWDEEPESASASGDHTGCQTREIDRYSAMGQPSAAEFRPGKREVA